MNKINVNFKQQISEPKRFATNPAKKEKTQLNTYLALTTGALVLAGVGLGVKKYCFLNQMRKDFSTIFAKNLNLSETNNLIEKYKGIIKISDKSDFTKQLQNQLRKDFGYENLPLEFVKTDGRFAMIPNVSAQKYKVLCKDKPNKELFMSYAHELRHIKQDEIAYRTGKSEFFSATLKRNKEELIKSNPDATNEQINSFIEGKIHSFYDKMWGNLPKIEKEELKEFARKINSAHDDYIRITEEALAKNDKELYRSNFIEKDAMNVEEIMGRIFDKLSK